MDTFPEGSTWRTVVGSWEHHNNSWLHLRLMISTGYVYFCCSPRKHMIKDVWYHIVALVSRNKLQLYVDGQLECTVNMSIRNRGTIDQTALYRYNEKWKDQKMQLPRTLYIIVKTSMENFWHGHIADVAIFDRWLEPSTIVETGKYR